MDRFERQLELEALLGGCVELAGDAESALAIEFGPVALETQGARGMVPRTHSRIPRAARTMLPRTLEPGR